MQTITVKFGGTSLASASQIEKAAAIIRSDPARRFVVASAPGKRTPDDTKVTDLLYRCHDAAEAGEDFSGILGQIGARFGDIVRELGIGFDLESELAAIRAHLETAPNRDYMASRGEYLGSKILAAYLGFPFVDAVEMIRFRADGFLDAGYTDRTMRARLGELDCAVVPGFYGAFPDGTVHTFSRGGSDVTGALVALATAMVLRRVWAPGSRT